MLTAMYRREPISSVTEWNKQSHGCDNMASKTIWLLPCINPTQAECLSNLKFDQYEMSYRWQSTNLELAAVFLRFFEWYSLSSPIMKMHHIFCQAEGGLKL